MQREIAAYLMGKLVGLEPFTKVAGLVQTLSTTEKLNEKPVPVRYPVTLDLFPALPGPTTAYTDVSPNSAETGILYAEGVALTTKGYENNSLLFESKLRIVGWLQESATGNALTAGPQAQANILRRLLPLVRTHNAPPFTRINLTPGRVLLPEDGLFSKYTYRQETKQFLLAPFTAFGIEVTTTFSVPLACLPPETAPIIISPPHGPTDGDDL